MNALQLVERLRDIEEKLTHLKLILDYTGKDMQSETNQVLTEIMKDYQAQYTKTQEMLSHTEVTLRG